MQSQQEDFWQDKERAATLLKQKSEAEETLGRYRHLQQGYEDGQSLYELAKLENDTDTLQAVWQDLQQLYMESENYKIECLFADPLDHADCFMDINAGQGGTDSCDFVSMLLRMYLHWAEQQHHFGTELISSVDGDEAGLRSVCIKLTGLNAFGWSKTESGVHRLVRMSPFNAAGKRQTSFASVWVYPVVDESIEVNIAEKDLRIDTYHSSGAGGQHVNTTDSAVRITHLPTGIVVQCQNERSQIQNRQTAMNVLRSRLIMLERQKREAEIAKTNAQKTDNSWGYQIRSYVLHPYQMVKDLRSGYERSDIQNVLNGDLDDIISSNLMQTN